MHVKPQYETQSLASDSESFLPTSFGNEGTLLYKYADSNMFSVITSKKSDPTTITAFIINGVTGRIIHQFTEINVSRDHAIS